MALFIDGPPASIEDLTDQDSGLLDICRTQQIDASVKLRLAQAEIWVELESLFSQQRPVYPSYYYSQPQFSIRHLAITPPLKMWHTWHTLALVYRDAYFNQLNDRFQAKWNEYRILGNAAKDRLRDIGVGLVLDPIVRPNSPLLTPTPASETGGAFYFAVVLQNEAGEQSAPSLVQSIQLADGNAVDVTLTAVPANARGWLIYGGTSPDHLYLQNDVPIALDGDWLFYPSTAILTGQGPGTGQHPNLVRAVPRLLPRG